MLLWASSESVFTGRKSLLVKGYKYSATVQMDAEIRPKVIRMLFGMLFCHLSSPLL